MYDWCFEALWLVCCQEVVGAGCRLSKELAVRGHLVVLGVLTLTSAVTALGDDDIRLRVRLVLRGLLFRLLSGRYLGWSFALLLRSRD